MLFKIFNFLNIMDRVLLIDYEGQVYEVEPPNQNLSLIVEKNLNSFNKRLIRISNCEWCFWGISSDFEVLKINFYMINAFIL